jgi:hypothetical protein
VQEREPQENILFEIALYELFYKGDSKHGIKSERQRFIDLYELKCSQLKKLLELDLFQVESAKGSAYAMSQKKRIDVLTEEVNILYGFYEMVTELMKLYDKQLDKMSVYYNDLPMKCYMQEIEIQNLKRQIKILRLSFK